MRQSQRYSATLQAYNTSLQNDMDAEKARREDAARAKEALEGRVAELGGLVKSNERMLSLEKEAAAKLRDEREAAAAEAAALRGELEAARAERDALAAAAKALRDELEEIKAAGGRSADAVEAMCSNKATLEAQLAAQRTMLDALRAELGAEREGQAVAEGLAGSRGSELGDLQAQVATLRESLADAERRASESELIRRKLHNTIQELKGNIRVFCRVRPPLPAELEAGAGGGSSAGGDPVATTFPASGAAAAERGAGKVPPNYLGSRELLASLSPLLFALPTPRTRSPPSPLTPPLTPPPTSPTGDLLGRGLEIVVPGSLTGQPPQKHAFAFDKVFAPTAGQAAIFEEISELVQSALDGHKVLLI